MKRTIKEIKRYRKLIHFYEQNQFPDNTKHIIFLINKKIINFISLK